MPVTFELDGTVGYITLDNPPANSYDLQVMTEFSSAVDEAIASDARAVIVRSASEKFFCGGADVKKFLDGDVDGQHGDDPRQPGGLQAHGRRAAGLHRAHQRPRDGRRPRADARLRPALRQRGQVPDGYARGDARPAAGQRRHAAPAPLIGQARAFELLITGRAITPDEALSIGLVSAIFPAEEAAENVRKIAERLAVGPGLAIANIKRAVREGIQQSLDDGLALEAELVEELFRSQDATEGLTAFVEKRTPEFVGA
jgi:enoyl-CoA hydratase/carnithine racemase